MKASIGKLVLATFTSVVLAGSAFANVEGSVETEVGMEARRGLFIIPKVNVFVAASPTNLGLSGGYTEANIQPSVSLTTEYFATDRVGFFVGADYQRRGLYATDADLKPHSISSPYLDLSIGPVFNTGSGWISKNARSHIGLGAFYALPLSAQYQGDIDTTKLAGSKTPATAGYFGILVTGESLFPLSQSFALGFGSQIKFGLGKAYETINSKYALDVSIGIAGAWY